MAIDQKQVDQTRLDAEEREASIKKQALLEGNLKQATPKQIIQIFDECSTKIQETAEKENKSPFGVFLVDEDSADEFQAVANFSGGQVSSSKDRLKSVLSMNHSGLDLSTAMSMYLKYTVMFTGETFSGTRKIPRQYTCTLKPDLHIDDVQAVP